MLTILQGDALSQLKTLDDESVQCCVTSPPYWSLRDYGIEPIVWDMLTTPWAPAVCKHEWSAGPTKEGFTGKARWQHVVNGDGDTGFPSSERGQEAWEHNRTRENSPGAWGQIKQGDFCECGAWRGCLGLEPTPELYVQHVVQIFRELKRVLRADGTLWVNLGDSYSSGGRDSFGTFSPDSKQATHTAIKSSPRAPMPPGLKPKDLVGIPWMVAFALRADGWYLRSDIIWSKPNPMPESVTDRPTKSHEYIFLFANSQKYFYDADAVREAYTDSTAQRLQQASFDSQKGGPKDYGNNGTNKNRSARRALENLKQKWDNESGISPEWVKGHSGYTKADGTIMVNPQGRNRRSVWTVPTAPFPEAHFATFPPDLVIPCVLAGSKAGDVILDPFAGSGTVGKVTIELGRKAILIEPKAEYVEMIERRCKTTIGLPFTQETSAVSGESEGTNPQSVVSPITEPIESYRQRFDIRKSLRHGESK